jgi:hypothetical protein
MHIRSATDYRLIPDINFNPMADVETGSSLSPGGIHNNGEWISNILLSGWPLNYGKRSSRKKRSKQKSKVIDEKKELFELLHKIANELKITDDQVFLSEYPKINKKVEKLINKMHKLEKKHDNKAAKINDFTWSEYAGRVLAME